MSQNVCEYSLRLRIGKAREVLYRFPVYERVRKTVPLLRGSFSISLAEISALSTSPKLAKSRMA
jgi:hypothetical protein